MKTWNLNKKYNKQLDIGKKKNDEYLGLEQKVQQIVGSIKKYLTNTLDLDKKLDEKLNTKQYKNFNLQ